MKVLVTGGAGYIGSHTIIDIIENTNWEIISVDDYSNSSVKTYDRIKKITGKQVEFYDVDLKDLAATKQVFKAHPDIQGIIHFAAYKAVGESVKKPLKYYDNNLNSIKNILICMQEFNIPYLIFSSSCSVYGNVTELPVTELSVPGKLESPYATTKAVGENMIIDFLKQNESLKAISLRYFNPIGAHKSYLIGELPIGYPNNLVPYINKAAIGKQSELTVYGTDYNTKDGTCVRDYIHVSDVANAHVLALKHLTENKQKTQHDIINLGSGTGSSVMEIIKTFEEVNKVKINYKIGPKREGDIPAIYANNDKAKTVLNWSPTETLEEMISSAWKWEQNLSKENGKL